MAQACYQGKEPHETIQLNLLAAESAVVSLEWRQKDRETMLTIQHYMQSK